LALDQIRIASEDKRIDVFDSFILPRTQEIAITNSLGVQGSFKRTNFYVSTEAVAKENALTASGFDDYSNCFYNEEKALKIVENTVSLAVNQLHAKPIESGKTSLIINPDGLAELFIYTFCREVSADLVQTNRSPFVNKLEKQVASHVLNIHDDGRFPKACGSKTFDDEGCEAQKTVIIEKGILKNFLHNTYTANKANTKNTGNSLRYALLRTTPKYLLEPSIGPSNLVIEPGNSSLETLISEVKNGIITKDFLGCHTASEESGNFSISLHCAFKIEKGEIKYPVKEAMIGGNILELLKNISLIANDVKQVQFMNAALIRDATLISPSIQVDNVVVAG
jgi:PmbA protein